MYVAVAGILILLSSNAGRLTNPSLSLPACLLERMSLIGGGESFKKKKENPTKHLTCTHKVSLPPVL